MQKVLSHELWKKLRVEATKSRRRQLAIAYVTQDLLSMREGTITSWFCNREDGVRWPKDSFE